MKTKGRLTVPEWVSEIGMKIVVIYNTEIVNRKQTRLHINYGVHVEYMYT